MGFCLKYHTMKERPVTMCEIQSGDCERLEWALSSDRILDQALTETNSDTPQQFRKFKYAVRRSVLSASSTSFLLQYLLGRVRAGSMQMGDGQVRQTPAQYGCPVTELLLDTLCPLVQRSTGLSLFPTYSYMRVYKYGDVLKAHTDRPACEVSLSLALGCDAGQPWPIYIDVPEGAKRIVLEPGDAVLYRGIECMHWREALDGSYAAQVFLHYVDQAGPHAAHKFDGRTHLNYPGA